MSRQTRKAIADQPIKALPKFKDEKGRRLHHTAIRDEITRRVKEGKNPALRKHQAKQASRVLK